MYDPDAQSAIEKVQMLQSLTGRDDLTGPILEEIVRRNTKLKDSEIELAKMVLVPTWKFIWRKVKAKLNKNRPR